MFCALNPLEQAPVYGFSNLTDNRIQALEERYGAHHYDRLNVIVRQACGSWITDIHGKRYLDCLAAE